MFKLKNNAVRSYGFAGRICEAGAGCTTPEEVAKAVSFRFKPVFEMSEEDMFKSWRGVIAAMKTRNPDGTHAIEVLIDGGPKEGLTPEDLKHWADEHREKLGWAKPTSLVEHGAELERVMDRPEDPLEVGVRNRQDERDKRLVEMVMKAVRGTPAPEPAPPPPRGRNDEKPEEPAQPLNVPPPLPARHR